MGGPGREVTDIGIVRLTSETDVVLSYIELLSVHHLVVGSFLFLVQQLYRKHITQLLQWGTSTRYTRSGDPSASTLSLGSTRVPSNAGRKTLTQVDT